MKLLFLDIDGVLNSTGSTLARTSTRWVPKSAEAAAALEQLKSIVPDFGYCVGQSLMTAEPTAIELMNRLVQKSGAEVVLSSSHRMYFAGERYGTTFKFNSPEHLNALNLYIAALGLTFKLRGITEQLYVRRGVEIHRYLEQFDEEIQHVVIDDGTDFEKAECVHQFVDPAFGFTSREYFACASILGVEESIIIF